MAPTEPVFESTVGRSVRCAPSMGRHSCEGTFMSHTIAGSRILVLIGAAGTLLGTAGAAWAQCQGGGQQQQMSTSQTGSLQTNTAPGQMRTGLQRQQNALRRQQQAALQQQTALQQQLALQQQSALQNLMQQ